MTDSEIIMLLGVAWVISISAYFWITWKPPGE